MLDINEITLRFGGRLLFNAASAHISDGQKVGLTGRNGTGKTTLFRLILGDLGLDDGEINITKGQRIATVAQEIPDTNISLIDCVLKADTERTALLEKLAEAEQNDDGIKIGEIHERLNAINANSAEARASLFLPVSANSDDAAEDGLRYPALPAPLSIAAQQMPELLLSCPGMFQTAYLQQPMHVQLLVLPIEHGISSCRVSSGR